MGGRKRSGRQVTTTPVSTKWSTTAERAASVAAGTPTIPVPSGEERTVKGFGAGYASRSNPEIQLHDLSHLPTKISAVAGSNGQPPSPTTGWDSPLPVSEPWVGRVNGNGERWAIPLPCSHPLPGGLLGASPLGIPGAMTKFPRIVAKWSTASPQVCR
jgi:hypothetical protein